MEEVCVVGTEGDFNGEVCVEETEGDFNGGSVCCRG